jgi:hypothetical protein
MAPMATDIAYAKLASLAAGAELAQGGAVKHSLLALEPVADRLGLVQLRLKCGRQIFVAAVM